MPSETDNRSEPTPSTPRTGDAAAESAGRVPGSTSVQQHSPPDATTAETDALCRQHSHAPVGNLSCDRGIEPGESPGRRHFPASLNTAIASHHAPGDAPDGSGDAAPGESSAPWPVQSAPLPSAASPSIDCVLGCPACDPDEGTPAPVTVAPLRHGLQIERGTTRLALSADDEERLRADLMRRHAVRAGVTDGSPLATALDAFATLVELHGLGASDASRTLIAAAVHGYVTATGGAGVDMFGTIIELAEGAAVDSASLSGS